MTHHSTIKYSSSYKRLAERINLFPQEVLSNENTLHVLDYERASEGIKTAGACHPAVQVKISGRIDKETKY
jgi:hypothetical protein